MKYPFADTPTNRKLEEKISQCVDPEMIVSREIGNWIFHALPHAELVEAKIDGEWDVDINYKSAHIFVINKETGAFGMDQLKDDNFYGKRASLTTVDVKAVLDAIKNDDLHSIVRLCPRLVNLDMGSKREELTYLDHYQGMLMKTNPSKLAYNLHMDWLIENGHLEAGSIEAPTEITHVVNNALEGWAGPKTKEGKPAGGNRLLTRYSSYSSVAKRALNEFSGDSLVRVENLLRDEHLRKEMKDVKYTLGETANPQHQPEIVLDLADDEYYKGRDKLYDSLFSSYKQTCEEYTERLLNSYKDVLKERYLTLKADISEDYIHEMVDIIANHMQKDVTYAKTLISDTPQQVRNKFQIIDYFDGNADVFRAFISDTKIEEGIESGKPMKEVLDHLPLLNLSKKTIANFLSNFHNYLSFGGQPVDFMTEKGPCKLTRLTPSVASVFGSNLHTSIALATTLPENHLIGEDRNASSMMEVLSGFPHLIETLSHRCLGARNGDYDIKNLMSWVPGEIEGMDKRRQTVRDAFYMLRDNYYTAIVRHLKNLSTDPEDAKENDIVVTSLKADNIIRSLVETGEYRNMLSFDDEVHKNIHQLFKQGKPDTDIEWGRTVEEDFEQNGYLISPITSNADLSQEGAELNHCVGSYLNVVLENQSYIFSVTKDGRRVSTIEINENASGNMEIVQHFAHSNTTPPQGAIDAGDDFCDAINDGDIEFETSPCPPNLFDEIFDDDMVVERQEVEFGLRFSDRDFVLYTIESMNRILPSLDIWEALEKESIPANEIEDLKRDFEMAYGTERSLEAI